MTFREKALTYKIELEGGESATVTGLRSECTIIMAGEPSQGQANISIWGMSFDRMNQMTTFGKQFGVRGKNKISVLAGDVGGAMALVYSGTILTAYMDGLNPPDVPFRIAALGGAFEAVIKSEPTSFQKDDDFVTVMQQLAKKMNLGFENGLQKKLPVKAGTYLEGSYYLQAKKLAQQVGAQMTIEQDKLVIWMPGFPRSHSAAASEKDGTLVGYPAFNDAGPIFTVYFNPNLRIGGKITVETSITAANGEWFISNLEHMLSSLLPNGPWFSVVYCTVIGPQPSGNQG